MDVCSAKKADGERCPLPAEWRDSEGWLYCHEHADRGAHRRLTGRAQYEATVNALRPPPLKSK